MFNILLYYVADIDYLEKILKLNLLFLGFISGKLVIDVLNYYYIKRRESYNELYRSIQSYISSIKGLLNSIDINKVNKLKTVDVTNIDKYEYIVLIQNVYIINEILFILNLIDVNLSSMTIIDKDDRDGYQKYVYSLVRMGLKNKGVLENGKWNESIKKVLKSTSRSISKIIDKVNN